MKMKSPQLPATYKSVELRDKGKKIRSIAAPTSFQPNTLIVQPILIGVCRSDMKELSGVRKTRSDFGHEIIGRVIWTNAESSRKVGDIVTYDPHISVTRNSGFSEYIIASGEPTDLPLAFPKISSTANLKKMILTEPMACAHHCVSRLRIYLGRRTLENLQIAIIGAGTFGTLIGLLAKHFGASVTVFNRSQDKLTFLEKQGLFAKKEVNTFDAAKENAYDVVIPTTSFLFPEVMKQATRVVKEEGLVLLFGGTGPGDTLPDSAVDIDIIRRHEKIDRISYADKFFRIAGSYGARSEDFLEAIKLLEDPKVNLPVEKFITSEQPFAKILEVFVKMQNEPVIGKNILLLND